MIMSIQISIREDDYVSGIVTIRNNEDASNLDAISMVKWLDRTTDILSRRRLIIDRMSENSEFYFFRTPKESHEKNASEAPA